MEITRKGFLIMQSAINALLNALAILIAFIPRLIGFLAILLIGWLVGIVVDKVLTALLRKVGFDRLSDRVGITNLERRMGIKMDSAQILGRIAFWFIFLMFLVPATDALNLPTVSNTLNLLVYYLPNVFAAVLVLLVGALLGFFAGDLVRGLISTRRMAHPEIPANIVRWAIIGFACLIALEQLQIAPALITVLFAAIVGGLALAFGLAFGLGGRESAQRMLARSEGQLMTARPYDPNQIVQQARSDLSYSEQAGRTPQSNVPPASYTSSSGGQPTSQGYDETPPQRPSSPHRPHTPRS
jgi:hypothetical protein